MSAIRQPNDELASQMRRISPADFAALQGDAQNPLDEAAAESFSNATTSVCPICSGAGWLSTPTEPGERYVNALVPCDCTKAKRQERRRVELLRLSNLGGLIDKTFASLAFVGNRSFEVARETARRFAQQPQDWLVLLGAYGCGKTHLAVAIANESIVHEREVLFCVVPDLLDHLRTAFGPQSTLSYDERFEQVRTVQLLILDDLGTENATPWAREKLYQIINHRTNMNLPTVITSNQPASAIDGRIISRVEGKLFESRVWAIDAPDYRRRITREQRSGWTEWVAPPSARQQEP